jgi:hypothetical protein
MAYSHPRAQAFLLGCVLFLTVGTYNVITFLGGAGQQTAYLSDGEHLPNLVCYAFDGSSKLYISMGFEFSLVVASILPTQVRCGVSTIPVTLVLSSLAGKKKSLHTLTIISREEFPPLVD